MPPGDELISRAPFGDPAWPGGGAQRRGTGGEAEGWGGLSAAEQAFRSAVR